MPTEKDELGSGAVVAPPAQADLQQTQEVNGEMLERLEGVACLLESDHANAPTSARFVRDAAAQVERTAAVASTMLAALITGAEGINTVTDNWEFWTDAQLRDHLRQLQATFTEATDAAEAAGIKA